MVDLPRLGEVRPIEGIPGGVPIPISGGGTVANQPAITSFAIVVPTPGTAAQGPSQAIEDGIAVMVRADLDNEGRVWVGGSDAEAEDHAVAYPLDSGDAVWYYVKNANAIFIDAEIAGEGVRCTVEVQ